MADLPNIRITWNGDNLRSMLAGELAKRLKVAAEVVRAAAVRSIREPYPPASSPGEPPHARTGHLFRSVFWESDATSAMVGTNVPYGLYLEIGTSRMAARPWLRPALLASQDRIVSIMTRPLPGGRSAAG